MSEQLKQELEADIDRSETGTVTIGEQEKELPEGELENEKGKAEDGVTVKQKAKAKLEAEKEKAKQKNFADPVITYLLKRCEEDQGLAEDVAQESKTWDRCFSYIVDQAGKIPRKGNGVAVEDHVVYEWAEDYYHKEEKPETKKKISGKKQSDAVNKAKPAVKKEEIKKNSSEKADEELSKKDIPQPEKKEKPKKKETPKKQDKPAMDGQMSLFDLL